MKKTLIIAEKPSVSRDIAKVVGAISKCDGYLEGNGFNVTWAIGHLVTLPQPHEIKLEWKDWRKEDLPLIPETWPLVVIENTKSQFNVVKKLIKACDEIICATDAGREGELIFRYIYEASNSNKPFKRLWISSLTEDAIKEGLKNLKEGRLYDNLYYAARARSCADWLIGMNLSRAYSLTYNQKFFVGRVQTPTLAMITKRDDEIRQFTVQKYSEIEVHFCLGSGPYRGMFIGEKEDYSSNPVKFIGEKDESKEVIEQIKNNSGTCEVSYLESKDSVQRPPALYDLTELQRQANRLFGLSAAKTLEIAQSLYEKHKLISYPRTSSRYLSESVSKTLKKIVSVIRGPYETKILPETGTELLGKRFVDDNEVTDHHALIPTTILMHRDSLSDDEFRIYDLICRRLLGAWQKDYIASITNLVTCIEMSSLKKYYFKSVGTVVTQLGWKTLEIESKDDDKEKEQERKLPQGLEKGKHVSLDEAKLVSKATKAPPHLTEASLLTAMESAGKTLDDKELALAIKDSGLGTPATRASVIETLLTRGCIERKGKSLVTTELGQSLIKTVHPLVKSPELTAKWEKNLSEIQNGQLSFKKFMNDLQEELTQRVNDVLKIEVPKEFSIKRTTSNKIDPDYKKKIEGQIKKYLSKEGACAAGKLFTGVSSKLKELRRNDFESILLELGGSGQIKVKDESFEKDGKKIEYRKVSL